MNLSDMQQVEFEGVFRRLIDLKTHDERTVVAWLEDDYHHFGLTLTHNGSLITGLRASAPRHPWTGCPGAAQPLLELVGKPLFGRCEDIGKQTDMRRQCTHLVELAGLLSVHAFHRRDHRRYEAALFRPDSVQPGRSECLRSTLYCDGIEVMAWELENRTVSSPQRFVGRTVDDGLRAWAAGLDEVEAEYAYVLRRAAFVGLGRRIRMTRAHVADEMPLGAVCHNYQPQHRKTSVRLLDSIRKFDEGTEGMLSQLDTRP